MTLVITRDFFLKNFFSFNYVHKCHQLTTNELSINMLFLFTTQACYSPLLSTSCLARKNIAMHHHARFELAFNSFLSRSHISKSTLYFPFHSIKTGFSSFRANTLTNHTIFVLSFWVLIRSSFLVFSKVVL